jgi:hypothetical protein
MERSTELDEDAEKARAAAAAGIPVGYSLKHWTVGEEPLVVAGSVFDADSVGRWIYDWAVYRGGPSASTADAAGDLWLLLITLAGGMKSAAEGVGRVRDEADREMLQDFISSGRRLRSRFEQLLFVCEASMWMTKGEWAAGKGRLKPARTAGVEFVNTMFASEPVVDETQGLMGRMQLWGDRFAANCEPLLRLRRTCEACGSEVGVDKVDGDQWSR